ncbi:MAG: hypothetical protein ABWK00_00120 [Desulfurococcaceae archaeon]
MEGAIDIVVDFARAPHVTLTRERAIKAFEVLKALTGSRDADEAIRIVSSFDEYYKISRKRFEEYIPLPRDAREALRGGALIQKLRLIKGDGEELVEIVFDRRVDLGLIVEALKQVGFSSVNIRKTL